MSASRATTTRRCAAVFLLDRAMSRFGERPERDELIEVLHELSEAEGDRFASFGLHLWEGYEALDRMEGHLPPWTECLFSATMMRRPRCVVRALPVRSRAPRRSVGDRYPSQMCR